MNTRKGKVAIFLWALSIAFSLFSAPTKIIFKRLSIEQGLSENSIYAILQDSKGFMWFGTEAGLNRYDGYNFTIYKPKEAKTDSLSNYFIYALAEDPNGNIWVGTDDGLNRFDRSREAFTRYLPQAGDAASISGARIYSLLVDQSGNLWAGTERGVNLFSRVNNNFQRFNHDPQDKHTLSSDDIRAIRQDGKGQIWIGTFGGGVNILDVQRRECTVYRHNPTKPNSLSDDYVLAILPDAHGKIWIGTRSGGLNCLDPATGQFAVYRHDARDPHSLSDNWINRILEDQAGVLWIATNDGGLNRFDRVTGKFVSYRSNPQDTLSLCGDRILSLYIDRSGTFWVGSYGGGLSKFRLEESNFSHYYSNPNDPASLSHNYVRSFCVDSTDKLWVGTDAQGLNLFERSSQTFIHYENDPADAGSLSNNRVFSIVEDLAGNLWVGTYGGLNRFLPQKGKFVRYLHSRNDPQSLSDDRIRTMSLSRSGHIWIGTDGGGLNKFDPQSGKFVCFRHDPANPDSIGYDRIFGVLADPDAAIVWVGTFGGGLNKLDLKTEKFVHYLHDPNNPHSISNNYVIPIIKSRDGLIWLGSNGGGLTQFDPKQETFRSFSEDDGLPNNTVYGILEDKQGNLWMSTNRGICRFNPGTKKIKNYDVNDGLQSNEFNGGSYYKSPAGLMYFGGINGFNEFDPNSIRDNPSIPPIVITDFQLLNKSVPIGKTADGRILLARSISETTAIDLSYRDYAISFEFSALSFVAPEKNQYAYMMEGFDRDWNYSGKRHFVTYTNLPPQTYTFRVKGSNNDGIWNENGVALRIRISPPFWKTWWFVTLSILLIGLAVYGWFAYRLNKLKKTKRELERLVALRTQELHELSLRDPLTGLRNRRFIKEVLAEEVSAYLKKKVHFLKNNLNRRRQEESSVYGILMLDIDHFKTINDQYGHDMGDKWLVSFAKIMRQCTRADDELIRIGGEEFLVVLKNIDPFSLGQVALKIKENLAKIDEHLQNSELKRTCSIGFSRFPFYLNEPILISFDEIILLADLGLYYAKKNGRNMVVEIIPSSNKVPAGEEIANMVTTLEFGLEKGFYSIHPSR